MGLRRGGCAAGLLAGLALTAGLTSCSREPGGEPTPETPHTTSSPSPTPTPSPTNTGDDAGLESPQDVEVPTWDEASGEQAIEVATAAATAFARPDLPYQDWWAGLQPYLSANARADFVNLDPTQLLYSHVRGDGELIDAGETSPYLATVEVDTDGGILRVLLARSGAGTPWLVESIEEGS